MGGFDTYVKAATGQLKKFEVGVGMSKSRETGDVIIIIDQGYFSKSLADRLVE